MTNTAPVVGGLRISMKVMSRRSCRTAECREKGSHLVIAVDTRPAQQGDRYVFDVYCAEHAESMVAENYDLVDVMPRQQVEAMLGDVVFIPPESVKGGKE